MRITWLLTVLLAFAPAAFGAEKTLTTDQVRALQSKAKAYDSLTVDFVQTKESALRPGKGVKRTGKALFVKPNSFKWMLETPTPEYKIFDGKAFYDYDPTTKTAKKYAASGSQAGEARQLIDLVLNFDSLLKRYDLVKATEDGDMVKIQLQPKAGASTGDLSGVELHFSKKDELVTYLKMDLKSKSSLVHEFRNPSHKPIPEDAFQLPKGVKVADSN